MSRSLAPTTPPADGNPVGWHIARTLTLAWPIVVSRAGLIILFSVDAYMAGQAGGLQLAGLGLGSAPLMTILLVSLGAMQATVVLSAQAIGRGEDNRVGAVLRAGLANALLFGVLTGLLALWAEPFFLMTGQQPAVAKIAAAVALQFAWGMPGQLLLITAAMVLEATERPRPVMVVMVIANLANILLDGLLVLGWGGLVTDTGGAATAMATSSVVRWLAFVAVFAVLVVHARRDGDRHAILARRADWVLSFIRLGGADGRAIRRMGLPMGLGQGVESAAFATVVFMAGLIGAGTLAAHQTTMTAMSLVFMIAVGLGGAASVRVGNAVGRRFPIDLRRAGWTAIGLGGAISSLCGVGMIVYAETLATFIVDDPEAVAIATGTLRLAGWFAAFDSMMGVTMGALRGLGDVWVPLAMQAAAFWFSAIPIAWLFGFHFGLGANGLFYGIGAGIAVSLALLLPRFAHVAAHRGKAFARTAAREAA